MEPRHAISISTIPVETGAPPLFSSLGNNKNIVLFPSKVNPHLKVARRAQSSQLPCKENFFQGKFFLDIRAQGRIFNMPISSICICSCIPSFQLSCGADDERVRTKDVSTKPPRRDLKTLSGGFCVSRPKIHPLRPNCPSIMVGRFPSWKKPFPAKSAGCPALNELDSRG